MKVKSTLNYKIEPEKYMYGIGEPFMQCRDTGLNVPIITDLATRMGFSSMRLWMYNKYLLSVDKNNELHFREENVELFKDAIARLHAGGITHIVAMCHSMVYPFDFVGDNECDREYPKRGDKDYRKFLEISEKSYEMIAARFPEIIYWEIGNEPNMNCFMLKPCFPKGMECDIQSGDTQYYYTDKEKAEIITDICYYCNRGIKKGNPNAYTVSPGFAGYRGYPDLAHFIGLVYECIESGDFPSFDVPDKNTDNYFQIFSWHPYNWGGDSRIFVEGCNILYNEICKHGDEGKKVFLTEFGYHDADFIRNGANRFEADSQQAAFFETDFKAFREQLPYVESVHIFRLFDWLEGHGIELDFGLLTSPLSDEGIQPKEKGKAMYRLMHGNDDGMEKLYVYSKKK